MKLQIHAFAGPSLWAPFPAVALEMVDPIEARVAASQVEERWGLLRGLPLWPGPPPADPLPFLALVAAIALHLQHPEDEASGRILVRSLADRSRALILLEYLDAEASGLVLKAAAELATVLAGAEPIEAERRQRMEARLEDLSALLRWRLPQAPIVRTLIREARRRSIPVSPVASTSHIWLFGHGSRGAHFYEAASDRDSVTGMGLARDKTCTKEFLARLGFPVPRGGVAAHPEAAVKLAADLGYPVVVKPISSGKGKGVSAGLGDEAGVRAAFSQAAAVGAAFSPAEGLSRAGVIVEKHVEGIDHRLAVFGGRLAWAVARHPALVVGDGKRTLRELLEQDNRRRSEEARTTLTMVLPVTFDEEMERILAKQGLGLEDRPATGRAVVLRSIANVSRGGTYRDVTEAVHPDNREMAEAIARAFRLDAVGIDLMTPAIDRSWREVPCAILEVNGMPGIFYDERAARVLEARFPAPDRGRIPAVLLIDAPPELRERVVRFLTSEGCVVGWTDDRRTVLSGRDRFGPEASLAERVGGLLADPLCDALLVRSGELELRRVGLPLDRFDLALGEGELPPDLRALVLSCCGELLEGAEHDGLEERLLSLLRGHRQA